MADPTDRTSMDDLTDAVAACDVVCCRTCAEETLTAVQSWLRERGLLLGPDGLLRATHVCDGDWDDDYDVGEHRTLSEPFACNWTDGVGEMVAGAPLFTLSPLDPPEDTPNA